MVSTKVTRLAKMLVLLLVFLFSGLPFLSKASAEPLNDAQKKVQIFIDVAKNKSKDNAGSSNLSQLTQQDLRFIGVYLSNFYVPYASELGYDTGDKDAEAQKKTVTDNMKKALTSQLGFNANDADVIIAYIFEQTRESASKGNYQWYFSEKGDVSNGKDDSLVAQKNTPNTVAMLNKMVSGHFGIFSPTDKACKNGAGYRWGDDLKKCWKDNFDKSFTDSGMDPKNAPTDFINVMKNGKNFAYLVDGEGHIAFSLDLTLNKTTASVAALMAATNMVSPKNGFGTSFFEFNKSEKGGPGGIKKTDDNNLLKNSIYGEKLTMDAFGNVIVIGNTHQFVMLPGSANPYTWKALDGKGGDVAASPGGSTLFMQNSVMLGNSGSSSPSILSSYTKGIGHIDTTDTNKWRNELDTKKNDSIGQISQRIIRGSSESTANYKNNSNWDSLNPFSKENTDDVGKAVVETYNQYSAPIVAKKLNVQKDKYPDGISWDAIYVNTVGDKETKLNSIPGFYFGGLGNAVQATDVKVNANVILSDVLGVYEGTNTTTSPESAAASAAPSGPAAPDPSATPSASAAPSADSSSFTAYQNLKPVSLLNDKGKLGQADYSSSSNRFSTFSNKYAGDSNGYTFNVNPSEVMDKKTAYSLYYTYLFATFAPDDLKGQLGFAMNEKNLAKISDNALDIPDNVKQNIAASNKDQMNDDIREWTWYLLHPSKGMNYFTTLVKNKSNAFVVSTHNDMVGTTNAPAVAGSTHYVGFSGYVTVPNLQDVSWMDKLYSGYTDNYLYFLMGIVALMGLYAVTGVMSIQKAGAGIIIFGLLAWLPLHMLNGVADTSNRLTNSFYSQKFNYWAIVQNQAFSSKIDDAATKGDYENYLKTQWDAIDKIDVTGTGTGNNNKGSDSVVVRWQAPKKMASLVVGDSKMDQALGTDNENSNGSMMWQRGMANMGDAATGQSFLDRKSDFLYRSYIDLGNFSRYIYKGIDTGVQTYNTTASTAKWPTGLKASYSKRDNEYTTAVNAGYNLPTKTSKARSLHVDAALSSSIVSDTFPQADGMKNLSLTDYKGIDTRAFSFGVPYFTKATNLKEGVEKTAAKMATDGKGGASATGFKADLGKGYTNQDYTGLAAYALMSESPFYYYSWNMYDQGTIKTDAGATNGYKDLILGKGGKAYFYNSSGNGEMRDYLDMKSLFTYTIPYLKAGNDVVNQYDAVYGLKYNEGVPTVEGFENNDAIKNDPILKRKYWQNLNISRLYGIYSPWVDLMYNASYAKPESINFQGSKVVVANPIDPSSYPKDRPMVFSKSEQVDYGIRDADLTEVERRIQKVSTESMKSMFNLLNMYNFNDNVLNTSAAMQTTFNFNSVFSESTFMGLSNGVTLYPQSYELKNFSYDAYLRLILANSTGESLNSGGSDFYTRIIQNSSSFTGLMMLLVDVMSVYILPVMKVIALFLAGALAILKIFSLCFGIESYRKVLTDFGKSVVVPLGALCAIFIGMGFAVSRFMSTGYDSVTGADKSSVSVGDPVMVIILMMLINALVVFLLFKVLKSLWVHFRRTAALVGGSIKGVMQGTVSMVKNIASGKGFKEARGEAGSNYSASAAGAGASAASGNPALGKDIAPSAGERVARMGSSIRIGRAVKEKDLNEKSKTRDLSKIKKTNKGKPAEDEKAKVKKASIDAKASGKSGPSDKGNSAPTSDSPSPSAEERVGEGRRRRRTTDTSSPEPTSTKEVSSPSVETGNSGSSRFERRGSSTDSTGGKKSRFNRRG